MNIRSWFVRVLTILVVGGLVLVAQSALAATAILRAGTVQGKAGGTVDVPLQAVSAPGLGALHMELVFDSKVLSVESVSKGSLAGSNALVDSNATVAGRVIIGLVTLDSIKGDGPVADVRFKVVGAAGTSSTLSLENGKAWESGSHAEVLVKTEAGKVTVTSKERSGTTFQVTLPTMNARAC